LSKRTVAAQRKNRDAQKQTHLSDTPRKESNHTSPHNCLDFPE
jgi:hypothetical protein